MADNKYSVDDILKELNSNKQRKPAPPPVQSNEDDFWELKRPAPRRPVSEQRPQREWEQPAPPAAPQPQQRRPMREPPPGVAKNPRLGQNIPPPRNPEEMGKLLGRFDDSKQDPLGNLDFLDREPEMHYDDTPIKSFVPDWDKQSYRQEPPRQAAPARSRQESTLQQGGRAYREAPPPQQAPPRDYRQEPPVAAPPQGGRGYVQQGGRRETSRMYQEDRRSMANAARLITSGGFEEELSDQPQPVRRPRQPQEQPYREQPTPQQRQQFSQEQPYRQQPAPQQRTQSVQEQPPYRRPAQSTQQIPPISQQPRATRDDIDVSRYEPRMDIPNLDSKAEPRVAAQESEKREGSKRESNQQVAAQLKSMRASLFIRVTVNLLALVGVVYLALAEGYGFPLPGFIAGAENMATFLWCAVAMVIVSAVISGNTIGGGILALLKLRPSNDTYTALAVFACLIQGAYMAMQPQLMPVYGDNLYLPMAALMLLFNTLGKLILLSRMGGSFQFVASKGEKHVAEIMDNREFARRISGDIVGEEPRIAYFIDAVTVDGFLEQAFSESKAEDISKIIAPMTAMAALVMALISYLFSRDIFTAACVYTAALCITAPLAGVIASNLPLSITNGKLARFGASICGYDAVNAFADTNGILLRCSQLFPKGSVSIQDIKVLDRRPIDQVILDAASVLCACDSDLSPIFRDMVQDQKLLHQPENLEYYDDMGLSAWVNGRRVLIGNRALMMSYGVSIPGVEFERPYTVGNNEVLYLANSGEAAAMYVLSYKADKQMRRAMELLCDRDMAVCLYSTDPNLTADKVSSIYGFPKELLSIIPASMQAGSEKYMVEKGRVKAAVVHNGSPASYLRTILAAQSCSRCITLETALILMSVVIGFAIVTFFAFTQQMETLTWVTIAVYQFFWLLIELVIPLIKH